ncbi:hypothetical protein FNE58_13755 [Bacillus thuringiensis]|nr:hypothetical protein FPG93_29380 [Bacillus thuringiensis]MDR5040546.1 hypothetical protein [Bacillus thuringiensis]QTM13098.1 hypothetical protein FM050_03745 [Bacillus thuringiensis]RBN53260.1 hypothetical protein DSD18_28460 [Bacillus thuringiensis]TBX88145.1 hypothetical protein E0M42_23490 [Bacillus thuringiensis]
MPNQNSSPIYSWGVSLFTRLPKENPFSKFVKNKTILLLTTGTLISKKNTGFLCKNFHFK